MSGDEQIRLIERRSQVVFHQLREKRIEISGIHSRLRDTRGEVERTSARFSAIKERLASTGGERAPEAQREQIANAEILDASLREAQRVLARQQGAVVELCSRAEQAAKDGAGLHQQLEQLADRKERIERVVGIRAEGVLSEELHEIAAIKGAKDRIQDSKRTEREARDVATAESGHYRVSEARTEPGFQPRSDGEHHSARQSAPEERSQVSAHGTSTRAFSEALSVSQREQVSALAAWERLGERGINFKLSLGAGRDVGVEVHSRIEGGLRVLIEPGTVRDSRALREVRSAIEVALKAGGSVVQEVLVRNRRHG